MADKALRTICLAYKTISKKSDIQSKDEKGVRNIEKSDLILVAICGIKDILREGVKEAVKTCKYFFSCFHFKKYFTTNFKK